MNMFKKIALVAILAATTQCFADEIMSSSGALLAPAVRDTGDLAPMSTSELASVEGGTYWGPLSENQILMAMTGFLGLVPGVVVANNIHVGTMYRQMGFLDALICKGGIGLYGVLLKQSQISAGRIDNRVLGYADMALSFGIGFVTPVASAGCSAGFSKVSQLIVMAEWAARDIENRKSRRLGATSGRKLLADTWDTQDRWVRWALDEAQSERDHIKQAEAELAHLEQQRTFCAYTPVVYFRCINHYDNAARIAKTNLLTHTQNFKKHLTGAGQAQMQHAQSLGIPIPHAHNLDVTYDIN